MKTSARNFLIAAACAIVIDSLALTICPACGYEADDGEARCTHCGALLPATAEEQSAEQPQANKPQDNATDEDLAGKAFEAAREDAVFGRKEEAKQPALALQAYENALALLVLAQDDPRTAKAGETLAESILRCRDAIVIGSRACPACNGSGKRTFVAHAMGGEDTTREVSGSVCPACAGLGEVRAIRSADELAGLANKCNHEYGIMRQGSGRALCGRVWIPAEWELTVEQMAAVRRARPKTCGGCGGFHDTDCKACKGLGHTQCKAKGCKQGMVERKNANSLSPKTELALKSPCPECKGSGHVTCIECKGDGRMACRSCKGSGLAGECRACHGEGILACKSCKGAKVDKKGEPCRACGGAGVMLCNSCQGDGHQGK